MKSNTLVSVITFPEDVFYPIGVHTLGLIVRKGIPHAPNQKVLWLRALNDGRWKKKGKRLEHPKAKNDYPIIMPILKRFIQNQQGIDVPSIPAFQKSCEIDFLDKELELVPEVYLDEKPITPSEIREGTEQLIRDQLAFKIKYENRLKELK